MATQHWKIFTLIFFFQEPVASAVDIIVAWHLLGPGFDPRPGLQAFHLVESVVGAWVSQLVN